MNIEHICDHLVMGLLNESTVRALKEGKQHEVLKAQSERLQKRVKLLTLIARVDQINSFFQDYQEDLDGFSQLAKKLQEDINNLTAEMQRETKTP